MLVLILGAFISWPANAATQQKLFTARAQGNFPADLQASFTVTMGERQLNFGSLVVTPKPGEDDEGIPPAKGPVIWYEDAKGKRMIDLREPFERRFIDHVYADTKTKSIYILLEWGTEGPANEYEILRSTDAGASWKRLADMKKPPYSFPPAELESFAMDRKGNGRVLFRMTTDAANDSVQERVYLVTTSNGGRTWRYDKKPWALNSFIESPSLR